MKKNIYLRNNLITATDPSIKIRISTNIPSLEYNFKSLHFSIKNSYLCQNNLPQALPLIKNIFLLAFNSIKMVSLSYYDEHLAWQQRVQKEITLAHRYK